MTNLFSVTDRMTVEEEEGALEALALTKESIAGKYTNLTVYINARPIANPGQPYLHIWRPQGTEPALKFLPCFHVIVTVAYPAASGGEEEEEDQDQATKLVIFQMLTFHGKLLRHQVVQLAELESTPLKMLDDLSGDNLRLCPGVSSNDLTAAALMQKDCDSFLIECFGSHQVVLRSRSCQFALDESGKQQCIKCQTLEESSTTTCLTKAEKDNQVIKPETLLAVFFYSS